MLPFYLRQALQQRAHTNHSFSLDNERAAEETNDKQSHFEWSLVREYLFLVSPVAVSLPVRLASRNPLQASHYEIGSKLALEVLCADSAQLSPLSHSQQQMKKQSSDYFFQWSSMNFLSPSPFLLFDSILAEVTFFVISEMKASEKEKDLLLKPMFCPKI